jgi:hypothetical protein
MRLKFSRLPRSGGLGRVTADDLLKLMENSTLWGQSELLQVKVPMIFLATGCFSRHRGGGVLLGISARCRISLGIAGKRKANCKNTVRERLRASFLSSSSFFSLSGFHSFLRRSTRLNMESQIYTPLVRVSCLYSRGPMPDMALTVTRDLQQVAGLWAASVHLVQ